MEFVKIEWKSELYQQMLRLRNAILREPLGLSFTQSDIEAEQGDHHFGLVEQGRVVACAIAVDLSAGRVKIRQMAVDAEYQRQGLGSELMRWIEGSLREQSVSEIELNARDVAKDFYRRLGYVIQGDEFIEVGIPHFKMTKRL